MMSDTSSEEVEVFLDPDNEVFFGPITEKEREIRKQLPRRTLHSNEIAEIKQKGLTYSEWETQEENNFELKYESCNSKAQSPSVQGDTSLNDTWDIQEKMLALAEKLERGENIPELGIYRNSSEDNKEGKEISRKKNNTNDELEKWTSIEKCLSGEKDDSIAYLETQIKPSITVTKIAMNDYAPTNLASSRSIPETPSKEMLQYPRLTPSTMKQKKQNCPLKTLRCKTMGAPSPVGIYIRSIPEPILIENIRLISKKQINTETIKNSKEEKIDEEIDITKTAKENEEVIPVLPAVLHTAAPSIHTDGLPKPQTSTPVWYRGKIGKLLDRNVTPTIFKHKGRVQISNYGTNSMCTPQMVQSSKSSGSESRPGSCKFSRMDVSILENVTRKAFKWTSDK